MDPTLIPIFIVVFVGGGAIGFMLAWFFVGRQLTALTTRAATAEGKLIAAAQGAQGELRLRDTFASLSHDALRTNSNDFIARAQRDVGGLVEPLKAALVEQQRKIDELERERQKSYGSIETMLQRMTSDQRLLQGETARLVKALRQPQVRGRWGEIQLRQVVELAGMSNLCDFIEQGSITDDQGARQRPDLQVRLPNQRMIVIDAKVPLSAYLDALECTDDTQYTARLADHARQIRTHITDMSKRDYQQSVDGAYDFLVLFIPGEVFYRAALEHDADLLEFAFKKNIILATPTTLIALLKAVAMGWREVRLAKDAHKIKEEGEKIYKALSTLAGYVSDLGTALRRSVTEYNKLIGNMDSTLFLSAKRLSELDVSSAPLKAPTAAEEPLRDFSRAELLAEPARDKHLTSAYHHGDSPSA